MEKTRLIYIDMYVGSVVGVAIVVTRCGKAPMDSKLRPSVNGQNYLIAMLDMIVVQPVIWFLL